MRFLHTSDWHLGRSFHQVGLLDAQAAFIDHLVETVRTERVDAVLVSGDVYDRALPAPPTVELLSEALCRLHDAGATVVLSSGNHDSAIRLGFASRLLETAGVHVRTSIEGITRPVELPGARVFALPYLEPAVASAALEAEQRTHQAVLGSALARVAQVADPTTRTVVMAHAFVSGAVSSDSERDIAVGGVSAVPLDLFDHVDYAALGHLHRPQLLSEHARYSGSPLAMSFSEAGQTKSSWLVDLSTDGRGADHVVAVPTPVHRPLAVVRGTLDELLRGPQHAHAESAYVQAVLTDPARPLGALDRLLARFPHLLQLTFEPAGAPASRARSELQVSTRTRLELCSDFLAHVRGGAGPTPAEGEILREAIEATRPEHLDEPSVAVSAPAPARAQADLQAVQTSLFDHEVA